MPKVPTTPAEYLAGIPANRRADLTTLHKAIRKAAPRLKPGLYYKGTILGYGPYHYKYASGREGDSCIVGLSSRAQYISLYIMGSRNGKSLVQAAKAKLGKTNCGGGCIRFKQLADLNLPVALDLVRDASALLDNGSTDFAL